jgi:hypothetical protein
MQTRQEAQCGTTRVFVMPIAPRVPHVSQIGGANSSVHAGLDEIRRTYS